MDNVRKLEKTDLTPERFVHVSFFLFPLIKSYFCEIYHRAEIEIGFLKSLSITYVMNIKI